MNDQISLTKENLYMWATSIILCGITAILLTFTGLQVIPGTIGILLYIKKRKEITSNTLKIFTKISFCCCILELVFLIFVIAHGLFTNEFVPIPN